MNRNLLGIIAAILLLFGGITAYSGPRGNSASAFAGSCVKAGLVLGALWLALPQILATISSLPGWLLGWFIKKQIPPTKSKDNQQPAQAAADKPIAKPPRPRRRSNA